MKHTELCHQGEGKPDFKFRVKQTFKSAIVRQISEAVMIRSKGEAVINSKGVYNRCSLPRLTLEKPDKELESQKEEQVMNEEEEDDWKELELEKRKAEGGVEGRRKRRRKEGENLADQGVTKQWGEYQAEKKPGMMKFLTSKEIIKPTQKKQTKLRLIPLPENSQKQTKMQPTPLPVNAQNEEERTKKRKGEYSYQEFKRDCKRLRPEFGNDEYEEFDPNPSKYAGLRQFPNKPIIFFSVFSKENAKKNHEIMFRKKYLRKPKLSSAKRVATSARGIKNYFEPIKTKIESNYSNPDQSGGEKVPASSLKGPEGDPSSVHL